MASEVLVPSSPAEAVELFGDGAATTVDRRRHHRRGRHLTYGRLDPGRVLLLSHAGLDGVSVDGDTVTIGATTPDRRAARARGARRRARRLRPQRRRLRDPRPGNGRRQPLRRRRARRAARRPPGLPARARRAASARPARTASGRSRSRTSSPTGTGRLVLDVSFERPAASAFVALEYPHTHEYTVLAVTACARSGRHHAARGDRPRRAAVPASARPRRWRRIRQQRAPPPSATSRSPTTRSPRPGTASRRCRCSSAVSSPNSRSPHEPHRQRGRAPRSRARR